MTHTDTHTHSPYTCHPSFPSVLSTFHFPPTSCQIQPAAFEMRPVIGFGLKIIFLKKKRLLFLLILPPSSKNVLVCSSNVLHVSLLTFLASNGKNVLFGLKFKLKTDRINVFFFPLALFFTTFFHARVPHLPVLFHLHPFSPPTVLTLLSLLPLFVSMRCKLLLYVFLFVISC